MAFVRVQEHILLISSKVEVAPGRSVNCSETVYALFRAERAAAVDGVDYDAFSIEEAKVGDCHQHKEARSATELLSRLRRLSDRFDFDSKNADLTRFSTCRYGEAISLRVKNVGAVPQRFAIRLVGKAVL